MVIDPAALPLTPEDVAYVETHFVTVEALCAGRRETAAEVRALMAAGRLPRAPYLLPDGERVPADLLMLADAAGGVDALPDCFAARFTAAAAAAAEPATAEQVAAEWASYLSGLYGVCLRTVTPENVFEKERLVRLLTARLAAPAPLDPAWAADVRHGVAALDALVRPFAPCDRVRFGGPVSRDRLITAVRATWPTLFVDAAAG